MASLTCARSKECRSPSLESASFVHLPASGDQNLCVSSAGFRSLLSTSSYRSPEPSHPKPLPPPPSLDLPISSMPPPIRNVRPRHDVGPFAEPDNKRKTSHVSRACNTCRRKYATVCAPMIATSAHPNGLRLSFFLQEIQV